MNRKLMIIAFVVSLCMLVVELQAQTFKNIQLIRSASRENLLSVLPVDVPYGADFYKITYNTTGSDGESDVASGVVVIPQSEQSSYSVIMYHHGTSNSRTQVPSSLNLEYDAYAFFGASGYIVLAPDYIGMGDSRGFHPYVHKATEASASVDMLKAFHEWADQEELVVNNKLFITGYSQGGHASMATHQELEANYGEQFPVTAASHLSGPYSLSGVMKDVMFSETDYDFFGYIPYLILGYQEVYGNLYTSLDEVFRPAFIPNIEAFYNGTIDLTQLTVLMAVVSLSTYGNRHPINVFNPDLVTAMRNDENHWLNQLLEENDTYNFVPEAPTRLMYCGADNVVPFQNSVVAFEAMKENGANDLLAIDVNSALGHGECAAPAIIATLDFFNSFNPVSIEPQPEKLTFTIVPNPANQWLEVKGISEHEFSLLQIFDLRGRLYVEENTGGKIDISQIPQGIYLIKVKGATATGNEKLVIYR